MIIYLNDKGAGFHPSAPQLLIAAPFRWFAHAVTAYAVNQLPSSIQHI